MEHYQVVRHGVDLLTEIDFEFTDRGTPVPLSAELVTTEDYTPSRLTVEGKVARRVAIDLEVEVAQGRARVTDGDVDREVDVPDWYFTVSGYAPVAVQMMLLRYWEAHGRPGQLQVFPSGTVTIESRGRDTVPVGDRDRLLDRYSIGGLIWVTKRSGPTRPGRWSPPLRSTARVTSSKRSAWVTRRRSIGSWHGPRRMGLSDSVSWHRGNGLVIDRWL
jgi:hypothetical protein